VAGDFKLEYNLTRDGRFSVTAFRNSDYDIFSAGDNTYKTGIGLQYRKDFNRIIELFRPKPKVSVTEEKEKSD